MLMHICLSETFIILVLQFLKSVGSTSRIQKGYQRTPDLKGTPSTDHTRQTMYCILDIKTASQKAIRDTDAFL